MSLGRQWKQKSVLKITKEIADIVSYSKLRRQNATRNREDNDKSEAVGGITNGLNSLRGIPELPQNNAKHFLKSLLSAPE